jgi:cyclohexadienyl dehydratase
MNRRQIPAAAAAAAALALPIQAQAQSGQGGKLGAIQAAGRIRVGTTGDFNPMSFRDPASREYRGHQIEAAQQLGRDMNLRVEFIATDWRTLINGLAADQFDVVEAVGADATLKLALAPGPSAQAAVPLPAKVEVTPAGEMRRMRWLFVSAQKTSPDTRDTATP